MAKLAIKGHETRGKEVIEILEMLGAKNHDRHNGSLEWTYSIDMSRYACYYYIDGDGNIECSHNVGIPLPGIHFTLEEFLEKYPYKVGDKIIYHESESEIVSMAWDGVDVVYTVNHNDELWDTIAYNLQPYKEAPMYLSNSANKQAEEIEEILEPVKEIMKEIKLDIPDGYEFFGIDDDNKIVLTKKQSQYPKTYEECIGLLPINWDGNVEGYKCQLLLAFQKLLICRDAYWKIAGEEMGLDKPWVPDFTDFNEERYGLYAQANKIVLDAYGGGDVNTILTFPTEEMRDAFYENFKDLIEGCKEFL